MKKKELYRLAHELADLTGESVTTEVTDALRERRQRVRRDHADSLADRLLAIGRGCSTRLHERLQSIAHGDLLYDERGLPP